MSFKETTIKATDLALTPEEPSLLFVQRELVRTNGIDFEEWWDEFKMGFPNGKRDKNTNFKAGLWNQPKYANITPTTSTSGAMTIEYWPEKDQPKNSYLLSGTCSDLISGIMAITREKAVLDSVSNKGSKPLLRGYPCIKLFFKGDNIKGVKQIRCVGFTDNTKIAKASENIKLLKEADINRWATKIKTIFGDSEYIWQKGRSVLSYSGMVARLQGVEGYAYVKTQKDGIALFTAMLGIFDQAPDGDGFNFSEKINVIQFSKNEKRPVGNCKFVGAELYLDLLHKSIPIVRDKMVLKVSI